MIRKTKTNSGAYVKLISFMGILIALQFVTEYYLSLTLADKYRISFTFLIRAVTGYCIGWLGGIVSAITDVLGGFLLYGGSMNPGITFTRFLQGLVVGIILYRNSKKERVVAASVADNLVLSLFLNTYFIFTYTGTPFTFATISPRVIIAAVSFVLEIILLFILLPKILPAVRKYMYKGFWDTNDTAENVTTEDDEPEITDVGDDSDN